MTPVQQSFLEHARAYCNSALAVLDMATASMTPNSMEICDVRGLINDMIEMLDSIEADQDIVGFEDFDSAKILNDQIHERMMPFFVALTSGKICT